MDEQDRRVARLLLGVEWCYELVGLVDQEDEALVTSLRFCAHRLGKVADRLDVPTEP